jgi:hypothetical protein
MDLKELKTRLDKFAQSLNKKDQKLLNSRLKALTSVFPFNEYEFLLMFLQDKKMITLSNYEKLRSEYVSANKYLSLYELAPRIFGEIWGQDHIRDLDDRFLKPSKKLDPNFQGQYDLLINKVRVGVKAARAINTKVRGSLISKALAYGSKDPFWMNFQQIKTNVADVFIFIGVWISQIDYWVLSNKEVKQNSSLSHQHRGGIEYQIGITNKNIKEFKKYKTGPYELGKIVIRAVTR